MEKHYILKIVESVYTQSYDFDGEGVLRETNEFLVSTRKIKQFEEDHDFAYGYVDHLIEKALDQMKRGFKQARMSTSEKHSFTDGGHDWYGALAPDIDCNDEIYEVEIDVNARW